MVLTVRIYFFFLSTFYFLGCFLVCSQPDRSQKVQLTLRQHLLGGRDEVATAAGSPRVFPSRLTDPGRDRRARDPDLPAPRRGLRRRRGVQGADSGPEGESGHAQLMLADTELRHTHFPLLV